MVRGAVFSSRSQVVQALFCHDFSIFNCVLPAVETGPASGTLKFICRALRRQAGEGIFGIARRALAPPETAA